MEEKDSTLQYRQKNNFFYPTVSNKENIEINMTRITNVTEDGNCFLEIFPNFLH